MSHDEAVLLKVVDFDGKHHQQVHSVIGQRVFYDAGMVGNGFRCSCSCLQSQTPSVCLDCVALAVLLVYDNIHSTAVDDCCYVSWDHEGCVAPCQLYYHQLAVAHILSSNKT